VEPQPRLTTASHVLSRSFSICKCNLTGKINNDDVLHPCSSIVFSGLSQSTPPTHSRRVSTRHFSQSCVDITSRQITEGDRQRIYMQGVSNIMQFLAYYLDSLPDLPPITQPDWLPLRYLTLESFIKPGGEETMEQKLATNRSLALDTRTRHPIIWALTLKVFLCSR
jgi:hypothetical protein